MDKKGFTLIEVIVSVVLVTIVMVSLTATLVELKKKSEVVSSNTEAVIYSSVVSRSINSDLVRHNGIKFVECNTSGTKCGLVLGDNTKRSLEIIDLSTGLERYKVRKVSDKDVYYLATSSGTYKSVVDLEFNGTTEFRDNTCEVPSNCVGVKYKAGGSCHCFKEKKTSTLLYKDITPNTDSSIINTDADKEKLLFIKTLSYIRTNDEDTKKVSTDGYGFSRLYNKQTEFKKDPNGDKSVLSTITIGIYDGIDRNDSTYNVVLYSSSLIDKDSPAVGNKYTIRLDSVGNLINGATQEEIGQNISGIKIPKLDGKPINEFVEVFNVAFNATNDQDSTRTITEIEIPEKEGFDFKGFFTTVSSDLNGCSGVQVLDESGSIIVPANYFTSNSEIHACWARH